MKTTTRFERKQPAKSFPGVAPEARFAAHASTVKARLAGRSPGHHADRPAQEATRAHVDGIARRIGTAKPTG